MFAGHDPASGHPAKQAASWGVGEDGFGTRMWRDECSSVQRVSETASADGPDDPYANSWRRLRRLRRLSLVGGMLAICFLVASAMSSSMVWIGLGIGAFLVFWLPASSGIESRCPHCSNVFFGERGTDDEVWRAGGILIAFSTLWTFFRVRACQRCLVPFGTAKESAPSAVTLAVELAARREAEGWRCACGTLNDGPRKACRRCWAPRAAQ